MPDPREMRDGHYTPRENGRLIPKDDVEELHGRRGVGPPPTRQGGQQASALTGANPGDNPPGRRR